MDRIVFSGHYIDRRADLRTQPEQLDSLLAESRTRFLPVWRGRCLIIGGRVARLHRSEVAEFSRDPERRTLLGIAEGHPLFCLAIDDAEPPSFGEAMEFVGLRELSSRLSADDAGLAAYAKALVAWQGRHRHCGVCGTRNRLGDAGFVMVCTDPGCGHRSFPRLDPAIIVLVQHDDMCLLGRQPSWPADRFSTIAGFVEPGESLEDAVRREVREETDIVISACQYIGSQPWPFPAALMIGFHASAATTTITCNDGELADARWVSRTEIAEEKVILPPAISIAYRLIESWFDLHDGPTLASLNLPAPPLRVPRPLDEQQ